MSLRLSSGSSVRQMSPCLECPPPRHPPTPPPSAGARTPTTVSLFPVSSSTLFAPLRHVWDMFLKHYNWADNYKGIVLGTVVARHRAASWSRCQSPGSSSYRLLTPARGLSPSMKPRLDASYSKSVFVWGTWVMLLYFLYVLLLVLLWLDPEEQ